ncbi:MAG: hypothetical protein ACKV2T_30415 [Kofleriaceae bacterium]
MSASAIERRLAEASAMSLLDFRPLARIDMSPEAIESRLCEWAELTELCLELVDVGANSTPTRPL